MIGLPFLPTVSAFESNVLATSKNLMLSPLIGEEGRVTVNPPPDVLQKICCLLEAVTPEEASTFWYAPTGNQFEPL